MMYEEIASFKYICNDAISIDMYRVKQPLNCTHKKSLGLTEALSNYLIGVTFSACGPLGP